MVSYTVRDGEGGTYTRYVRRPVAGQNPAEVTALERIVQQQARAFQQAESDLRQSTALLNQQSANVNAQAKAGITLRSPEVLANLVDAGQTPQGSVPWAVQWLTPYRAQRAAAGATPDELTRIDNAIKNYGGQ